MSVDQAVTVIIVPTWFAWIVVAYLAIRIAVHIKHINLLRKGDAVNVSDYFTRHFKPVDATLWERTGRAIPSCTADACGQDSRRCPCPDECRLPEPEADRHERAVFWRAYLVALAGLLLGAIFWPH